jgi:hypothetical protein
MIYVSVQPDNPYFFWQVEVYCHNLINWGVKPSDIHVVWLCDKVQSDGLRDLMTRVRACHFLYQIEDVKGYLPALKPQGMKHHFHRLGGKKFLYHDSDIIFLKKPMLDAHCACSWSASDCKSYLSSEYIKSKSPQLFNDMCNLVGVNPRYIETFDSVAGGAQWIMNNTSYEFWEKVEKDSVNLYYLAKSHPSQTEIKHPIQSWTAEMWATLWNAIAFGKNVAISKGIDFTFATSRYSETDRVKILHMAGVTHSQRKELFFKGDYTQKSPIGENFEHLSKDYASWRYVEEMKKIHNFV